ncbi:MAG: pyrroline-5-carboxylate reductase [Candidatus Dasytiphilus stammeri]
MNKRKGDLMKKRLGFLGGGNIAETLIAGLVKSRLILPMNIYVYDCHQEKTHFLHQKYGINFTSSEEEVIKKTDILFLAVKRDVILNVLKDKFDFVNENTLVISLAAGITLDLLKKIVGPNRKILRVMPNTAALVGESMTSITSNTLVTPQEIKQVVQIFNLVGKTAVLTEDLIHSVIGVSSSAPAYVYIFIEAMADAAVLGGMSREKAYKFAAQAVKGAAEMILTTGKHPAELKDKICSPKGTTIEALKVLEEKGFRASIICAIYACMQKSILNEKLDRDGNY